MNVETTAMKVDFYASSVSGVYLLLVLDSAICAFGNAVDSPGASQPTELALLVLQAPRTICRRATLLHCQHHCCHHRAALIACICPRRLSAPESPHPPPCSRSSSCD